MARRVAAVVAAKLLPCAELRKPTPPARFFPCPLRTLTNRQPGEFCADSWRWVLFCEVCLIAQKFPPRSCRTGSSELNPRKTQIYENLRPQRNETHDYHRCTGVGIPAVSAVRGPDNHRQFYRRVELERLFAESGKSLVVTNGRMNFTSSTTAGGGGGIARNTPFLTTTQDWSIKLDVHLNPFVITNEDHGVSVFLGVGKSSDWLGTHVLLGFDRDSWGPQFLRREDSSVQVNGSSVPGFFNINFLPSADATLRLDYNAANQTITYYCDSDGSAGGGGWTTP